jgi:hypothetical protein
VGPRCREAKPVPLLTCCSRWSFVLIAMICVADPRGRLP